MDPVRTSGVRTPRTRLWRGPWRGPNGTRFQEALAAPARRFGSCPAGGVGAAGSGAPSPLSVTLGFSRHRRGEGDAGSGAPSARAGPAVMEEEESGMDGDAHGP